MNIIVLGIDPGKCGALAVFCKESTADAFTLLDIVDFNEEAVLDTLTGLPFHSYGGGAAYIAYIEHVHAAPGQSTVAMFNFGKNFGWWLGVLATQKYSVHMVSPQRWQFGVFKKKPDNTKDESLKVARELFPNRKEFFKRKKDNGRSDATLIGYYGIVHGLSKTVFG